MVSKLIIFLYPLYYTVLFVPFWDVFCPFPGSHGLNARHWHMIANAVLFLVTKILIGTWIIFRWVD